MLLHALVLAVSLGAGPEANPAVPAMSAPVLPPPAEAELGGPNWQWRDGDLREVPPAAAPQLPSPAPAGLPSAPYAAHVEDTVPYYDPFTRQLAFGNAGFQPYQLGWYFSDEVPYMPTSPVQGVAGSFQDIQYNATARYARLLGDRHLLSWTGAWNSSWWTGPSGVNLPPGAEQLVSDIQISSLHSGRWNWQIGVTPQVNADFRRALDHNAYMVDGRFVLFYQARPDLRLAAGIEYWNRVRGVLIPYGGLIWAPDDRWEFRLFFPQTRISRYCGKTLGKDTWAYTTIGYEVQAWQVTIEGESPAKTRMQMSDVQLLVGTAAAAGVWTAFIEGGLIFNRRVLFRDYAPPFTINDALMVRIGARY
ncbi:MAG TPA: hypothetical protein VG826_01635 [Pirellulales bacterium]|nr:hypothetical protein [Pirellulales bacterium]